MATSVGPCSVFRCAVLGILFASASSTREARRVANSSNAVPPESINTTIEATRYSWRRTAVTIEAPAKKSEPKSAVHNFLASWTMSGKPPAASATNSGIFAKRPASATKNRSAKCAAIPTAAISAIGFAKWDERSIGSDRFGTWCSLRCFSRKATACCASLNVVMPLPRNPSLLRLKYEYPCQLGNARAITTRSDAGHSFEISHQPSCAQEVHHHENRSSSSSLKNSAHSFCHRLFIGCRERRSLCEETRQALQSRRFRVSRSATGCKSDDSARDLVRRYGICQDAGPRASSPASGNLQRNSHQSLDRRGRH